MFAGVVVPPFKQMFEEFGLQLPLMTTHFLRSCEVAVPLFALSGRGCPGHRRGPRVFGGRSGWSWLITNLPLIGHAWHWTGVAEMLRCLSLLVEHRVPLPEALRLTAGGITDAYVGRQCRRAGRPGRAGHVADDVAGPAADRCRSRSCRWCAGASRTTRWRPACERPPR